MKLTALQEDALTEVINIGFGRAAASLSKLTGQRVQLEAPHITMCPIDELSDRLRPMIQSDVASVHQISFPAPSQVMRCSSSTSTAPQSSRSY